MEVTLQPLNVAGLQRLEEAYRGLVFQRVEAAVMTIAERGKKSLESQTEGWNPMPLFTISGSVESGSVEIGTDDFRFKLVDEGARPHAIVPRKAKVLVFQAGYSAKTLPGRLIRGSGTRGGDMVFAKRVNHPGIRARKISERLQGVLQEQLNREIDQAIAQTLGG